LINLKLKIRDFFTKGHERTLLAKRNIIGTFGIKGISIIVQFLLVPLTLNYLNPVKYGIWLTLSAVIGWLSFFDIGLGNGLRNKLTEALAINDFKLAKIYVSTTYAVLFLIISGMLFFFLMINPFLNWSKILNATSEMAGELSMIAVTVFTFFSIRFILNLIGVIFTSNQLPIYNEGFALLGNLIALLAIFIITKTSQGNLLYISIAYSSAPVIILIIVSVYFFNGKYQLIKPSIKAVNFKYFKPLAGLGVKFFVLQLAVLIIFSTDNMIITQLLGPAEVIPYNIAFRYFGISIMIFSIILSPFWSAFTDAMAKKEMVWIENSIKKLLKIWLIVAVLGVVLMIIISKYFYLMWVGDKVHIPLLLSVFMGIYAIIMTWNNIFTFLLNGIGKIKLQMYYGIIGMLINIPVSIFLAKNLGMGSTGVILGTCISLFFGTVLGPIQVFMIIKGNANGIWNK